MLVPVVVVVQVVLELIVKAIAPALLSFAGAAITTTDGVHININPDTGKHEAVLRNLHVCVCVVPAAVPAEPAHPGDASGIAAVNLLLLKSVFALPLKPTYG
jgi:hypothetical protein